MPRPRAIWASAALALATGGAGAALVATAGSAAAAAGDPLPAHVYAPYVETWNGDNIASLAQQSGAYYQTLAFIQTASSGSCTAYWDGESSLPLTSSTFGSQIDTIRANGGDVVPSFGGYSADHNATEIADSCSDVDSIAAVYEQVVTAYDVTRLDMDIEDNSLTNSAGITRRNQAIKQVQDWAAANGRTLQIVYTLPTTTHGLASSGLNVLRNAKTNGARVDLVNIMTFDYYDGADPHNMAADTQSAATGLHNQLANLYPDKSSAQLWSMIGVTEMPGIDDYGAAETFTTADATAVYDWAAGQGIGEISIWALQRDRGNCSGSSDSCSGISQDPWYFSHTFEPFTSGTSTPPTTPTTPPTNPTTPPTSPTAPPAGCSAPAWDAGAVYTGGQQVSYDGHLWTAKWWTQGDIPGNNSQNVWTDDGSCTGGPTTAPTSPTTAPTSPTSSPSPTGQPSPTSQPSGTWAPYTAYQAGDVVTYDGVSYQCRQAHTSLPGWEPPNVPALWQRL